MEFIEFDEAGIHFEIQGPILPDQTWLVCARFPDGEFRVREEETWFHLCERVDLMIREQLPKERQRRVRIVRNVDFSETTRHLDSRGRLLWLFPEGHLPSTDELRKRLEEDFDVVLWIRDGKGAILLDRRHEGRLEVERRLAEAYASDVE